MLIWKYVEIVKILIKILFLKLFKLLNIWNFWNVSVSFILILFKINCILF